jgi:hypothetical protein
MSRINAIAIVALAASMLTAPEARAGLLHQTGFEPPDFVADAPLAGQGGFVAFDGVNEGAALVSTELPNSGAQSVRIDGSSMEAFEPDFFAGFYFTPINYDPIASGTPLIDVRVDVALSPDPAVGSVAGYQIADTSGALIAEILLSSDGSEVFVTGDNGVDVVDGPVIALGQYSTLGLLLDYGSRNVTLSLDGTSFGTLAFGPGAGETFGDASLFLAAVEPFTSVAFFDNYSVVAVAAAVPEPSSMLLAGTGGLGLLAYAHRHRRVARRIPVGGGARRHGA